MLESVDNVKALMKQKTYVILITRFIITNNEMSGLRVSLIEINNFNFNFKFISRF